MPPPHYSFRPAARRDLPLLGAWLRTPEVIHWWGDPVREEALLAEDLCNPQMAMRIVSHHGRPFAYAQDYDAHAWPQPHLVHLPLGRGRSTPSSGFPR
jgi:aminoglycoside 6'-N-acetyltransferase